MRPIIELGLYLCLLVSALLCNYTWQRRFLPGAKPFLGVLLAIIVWGTTYYLGLRSDDLETKVFWLNASYLGSAAIPAACLYLVLHFTQSRLIKSPRWMVLLIIEPVLMNLLVWTNPLHKQIYSYFEVVPTRWFSVLAPQFGPLYTLHVAYSQAVLIVATAFLIHYLAIAHSTWKRQVLFLLVGIAIPWLINLLFILQRSLIPGVNLTPYAFSLTSPLLAYALFRFRIFDVLPVAYDAVIESMQDGAIVLDNHYRVMVLNPAAKALTGLSSEDALGAYLNDLLPDWHELEGYLRGGVGGQVEIISKNGRYLEVQVIPVFGIRNQITGRLVILRDVSERKNMEKTQQRRTTELEALHATLLDITASPGLDALLQTITERAARLLNAHGGCLYLCDPEHQTATCVVNINHPQESTGAVYSYGSGEAGTVAAQGTPLIIDNYREYEGHKTGKVGPRVYALASVPMTWQQQVTGVISVFDVVQSRQFTQAEVNLLLMLANQAAIAVENARLLQAERKQRQNADILRQVASVLNATLDTGQVLQLILEQLAQVVAYDSASVMLIDQGGCKIVAQLGFRSEEQNEVSFSGGELGHIQEALDSQHFVIIPDAHADPRWHPIEGDGYIRSWLGVPLVFQGISIGLLNLDKAEADFYSETDAKQALAFANQAATAIKNAQLFASAEHRAEEAETLRQATAAITATLDMEEAVNQILLQLARVVPYDSASVQLLKDGCLEIVGGRGWDENQRVLGMRFPIPGDNPNTRVIEEGQTTIFTKVRGVYAAFDSGPHNHIRSWMGTPLKLRDRLIGMLALDSKEEGYFNEGHARLARAFADQVSVAIENSRLYMEERKRVDALEALRIAMADISSELDLANLLQSILKRSVDLLKAAGGEFALFVEATNDLEIVASYQMGKDFTGLHLELGHGAMGHVGKTRQPLMLQNYSEWEGVSNLPYGISLHSALAVPVLFGNRLVGVLGVIDTDPERIFDTSELRLMDLFAQQAAIAVENARLYKEAREAADRRMILHRASQDVVSASMDPEKIYEAVHQAASQLMPTEAFAITILNESTRQIDCVYMLDHTGRAAPISIPSHRGLSSLVISTGNSVYIDDIIPREQQVDTISFGSPDQTVRSILAVPLRIGEKILGMLSAQSYYPNAYTPEDQRLLEMLASYATIAIENARLFGEVQTLAITDPLTGVYNRRHMAELGQKEFVRSRRFQRPISVIMLDIDHFKDVNDTYGHAAGDAVLQNLTRRILNLVREIDIVGRYGGEEFTIILPETECSEAMRVAERLRTNAASVPVQTERDEVTITICQGVAQALPDTIDFNHLVAQADAAMYDAKRSGRDRVSWR